MINLVKPKDYYQIIAKAISYLAQDRDKQLNLKKLSAFVGLSGSSLQCIFSEWGDVSAEQCLGYLTKEHAKKQLKHTTIRDAVYTLELSETTHLHNLMIHCEYITVDEYKHKTKELTLTYGFGESPFGLCFIAVTHRGICQLAFFDNDDEYRILEERLRSEWKNASIIQNNNLIASYLITIFDQREKRRSLNVLLKGSPFQIKVWEALLSISKGNLATYQDIATSIEKPAAVRAIASAIAKNNIAYLIPCHRVIRKNGDFGKYRWNKERKQAMIAWERWKKSE